MTIRRANSWSLAWTDLLLLSVITSTTLASIALSSPSSQSPNFPFEASLFQHDTSEQAVMAANAIEQSSTSNTMATTHPRVGNPIFPGWYADPEARIFFTNDNLNHHNNHSHPQYWIYPTFSALYEEQTFFDAFSSPDLLTWTKHARILDFGRIPWSTNRAAWAPSVVEKKKKKRFNTSSDFASASESEFEYFMYFSAGDGAGIGVARSETDHPAGPFQDVLGRPLVPETVFGAEPIDAQLFVDPDDGRNWLYFGGWGHAVVVEVGEDMVSLKGEYIEITPPQYVEGPWVLKKNGVYYFMYSVGGWGDDSYGVAYVTGPSPTGPFSTNATRILAGDPTVGTSTGHHSVMNRGDDYYIVYHRRYPKDTERDHRVVCIDRMYFDETGAILPVKITTDGVEANPL